MIVAIIVALCVGVGLGVVISRTRLGRVGMDPGSSRQSEPSGDDRDGVTEAMAEVANHVDFAVVLGDPSGMVLYRNRAADAMRGTHVGVIVDEHIDAAIDAAASGRATDKRIDLHGPPRVSLELVAQRMDNGCCLVMVNDVSERTRIDAIRTDFVANISHELKTPVGAIAVLSETLEGETDLDVIARVSNRIVDESHRAVTTIDDLLELSRIESARPDDDIVDVNDVVLAAVARGRVVDQGKGVSVTAFGAQGEVLVRADRRQLTSAIGNLVENAVKYSDENGVVQVRTRIDDRWIEVMVTDQGLGIPQRDLDRIFERFYRVDRARSRETGGTGLGLSIVRHVASNHGGEVVVSSQEGEGSTFVVRLPATLLVDDAASASMNSGLPTSSHANAEAIDE